MAQNFAFVCPRSSQRALRAAAGRGAGCPGWQPCWAPGRRTAGQRAAAQPPLADQGCAGGGGERGEGLHMAWKASVQLHVGMPLADQGCAGGGGERGEGCHAVCVVLPTGRAMTGSVKSTLCYTTCSMHRRSLLNCCHPFAAGAWRGSGGPLPAAEARWACAAVEGSQRCRRVRLAAAGGMLQVNTHLHQGMRTGHKQSAWVAGAPAAAYHISQLLNRHFCSILFCCRRPRLCVPIVHPPAGAGGQHGGLLCVCGGHPAGDLIGCCCGC